MQSPVKPASRRAKVLHLITLSVVGGSQDNTFGTCERHDRSRFEVHLATNSTGRWMDRARASADAFHPIDSYVTPPSPLNDLKSLVATTRLLRRERYDILHTHTAKAGFIGRLAARFAPVPIVVHTYHAFPWHDHMSGTKRGVFIGMERLVRDGTHYHITVSENERQEGLRRRVLREPDSRTIYSGIDFTKLDRPVDRDAIRASFGWGPRERVIGMVGRLDAQKAPELMVQAFARVAAADPLARLMIVGDGELRPNVEERIRSLGLGDKVKLLGFRDDVPSLVQASDIFALSSLWEGLGRAMTEAMLVGKAVVVPAINGIPEIVHEGRTGLLYPAGQVDKLADGILRLLADPSLATRLGNDARLLTRSLFDLNGMVRSIEEVFTAQLAKRS